MGATAQPQKSAQNEAVNWRKQMRKMIGRFRRSYLVRVVAQGLLTIWAVLTFTFFLIRLMPGNPLDVKIDQLQRTQGISYQQALAQASGLFGFDPNKPLGEQYIDNFGKLLRGDLGQSITSAGTPAAEQSLS